MKKQEEEDEEEEEEQQQQQQQQQQKHQDCLLRYILPFAKTVLQSGERGKQKEEQCFLIVFIPEK